MKLYLDFETRSTISLKDCGLDVYAKHPDTEVLMLAWARNEEEPQLWEPRLGPMPGELRELLLSKDMIKSGWNFNFEKDILEFKLGIKTELKEWNDPSVLCAYMSLPIGLHRAGEALSISGKKIHVTGNNRLTKMFGELSKATKKAIKGGAPEFYYKDWNSHPEKWQEYREYCLQDVRAEREIYNAAVAFNCPMTEEENRAFILDQKMNETGVWIDQPFVRNAKKLAEDEAKIILGEIKEITGVENPNSRNQILAWCQSYKYPFTSLDMTHVEEALKLDFLNRTLRKVLELKEKLGGSAYKKLESILDRVGPDGRLKDQFVYHGAHTGRWSGRGSQPQNLYKTDKSVKKFVDEFTTKIRNGEKIDSDIPLMTIIASTVRSSFAAAPGMKLVVGDLAQIESRVLAVISGCKPMMTAYKDGHDLYKEFMSWLLNKPVSEITDEERSRGKIVILGCGFSMGWEKFMNYAASFGVILTEKQAKEAVEGFREKYPEIVNLWSNLNTAVIRAVKLNLKIYQNHLVIDGRDPKMLKVFLPSGRALHYLDPQIVIEQTSWGKLQEGVNYTSFDVKGKKNKRLYGGLITENAVQAIARDLLLSGMFLADEAAGKVGGNLTMTVHDEIVCEVPEDSSFNTETLLDCMRTLPKWAEGMGFVLAAEGWSGQFYKK
jgi:DNA polymerase